LEDLMRASNGSIVVLAFAASFATPHAAAAQSTSELAIERFSCRDLLRESGTDRDVAVAFLHGYLLGKAGVTTFARESARAHATDFIERCLDDPKQSAIDTMMKAASGTASGASSSRP
jgi:hypothetical protein